MKKHIWSFTLIVLALLAIVACKKDSNDDPEPAKMLGWAVGTSDGVYGTIIHTKDGGTTWIRQGDSIQLPNAEFGDIWVFDENTLLVVGDPLPNGNYNVMKSVDGGETWLPVNAKGLANVLYYSIFALNKDHIWIVGESGSIYRSDDMAVSWTKIEVPLEYQSDLFTTIAARDEHDIWVVGDQHLPDEYPIMLHTTDGGTNWERLNPTFDLNMTITKTGHFLGIKVFGNSVWAIGGNGMFVIRSTDFGSQWSDITANTGGMGDANDIYVLSETEAYVVKDHDGIFHTSDGGQHWDKYTYNLGQYYMGIAILQQKNIWIVGSAEGDTSSAIIFSPDGGLSWQEQTPQFMKDNKAIQMDKVKFIEH